VRRDDLHPSESAQPIVRTTLNDWPTISSRMAGQSLMETGSAPREAALATILSARASSSRDRHREIGGMKSGVGYELDGVTISVGVTPEVSGNRLTRRHRRLRHELGLNSEIVGELWARPSG
jgi:hypothetical protein